MAEPIEERLRRLETRLARLESQLAMPPPLLPSTKLSDGSGIVDASNTTAMVVEKLDGFTESDWRHGVDGLIDGSVNVPPDPPFVPSPYAVTGEAMPIASPPVLGYEPPMQRQVIAPGELERTIGLKWTGWFGAIVVVVGAALAIKFAFDQGWFGSLPDVVKLLLMSLGGFGLIGAGEVVLRRVNRVSAAGLYGAGVSVLFLVGYAGYEWYDVYAQGSAFVLMGAATLIGVLVAARADLVSIAVLSLIGGHVVPLLLGGRPTSSIPLLSFLLLLQILALALCFWQATPKWWVLRSVSLVATLIWQLMLATAGATAPADAVAAVTVFATIFWVLYQLELALTTLRVAHAHTADVETPAGQPAGLLFSVLVTAQAMLVLLLTHDTAPTTYRGALVIAAASVCAGAGVVLWLTRQACLAGLSASLRAQAAALLILAVPVTLNAQNVVFGWLTLSIVFGLLAISRRLRISAVAAIGTWLLAVCALAWWTLTANAATEVWLTIAGVTIPAAVVVAAIVTVVGHAAATLFRSRIQPPAADEHAMSSSGSATDSIVMGVHGIAGVVWALAAIRELPVLPATLGLLIYAWLMYGISYWRPVRQLAFIAAAAVLAAAVKWAAVDLLQERLSATTAATTILNTYLFFGLLIAASMVLVGWGRRTILLPRGADEQSLQLFRSTLTLSIVALMTLALSTEISVIVEASGGAGQRTDHTRHLAWTMLWVAAAAIVLLLDRLAFKPGDVVVGRLAAIALVLVAVKYILLDALTAAVLLGPTVLPVVLNLQTLAGIVTCGGLVAIASIWPERPLRFVSQGAAALVVFVIGTVETDRFAAIQTAAPTWIVRQAGWSIWWSTFAVVLVIIGFIGRAALLRGLGLALLGLTLMKVVLVDLSGVGSGWRVLSFFGLGLLLLGTSVLYGRHGGRLLTNNSSATAVVPRR